MYGESDYQEEILEAEKAFQVKYFSYFVGEVKYFFFCFVDMAITSLKGRFKELMVIKDIYSDYICSGGPWSRMILNLKSDAQNFQKLSLLMVHEMLRYVILFLNWRL